MGYLYVLFGFAGISRLAKGTRDALPLTALRNCSKDVQASAVETAFYTLLSRRWT